MKTEIRRTAPHDDSEHLLRWTQADGQQREHQVSGEAAAMEAWTGLHAATVDPVLQVREISWVELVQVTDENGQPLEVVERQRATFSHSFAALGVYDSDGDSADAGG